MRIAYCGNFKPDHSTESHVRQAFENEGHSVIRVQEDDQAGWETLIRRMSDVDLVLWTRTASMAANIGHRVQWNMLAAAERAGVPTVAYHLDRWWGLNRESSVWEEPFFRCSVVVTADGGHQEEFASVGVKHVWLPPAVSSQECELGTAHPAYRSRIAFVGSWQGGYHAEWSHRTELVAWLKKNFPETAFWPRAHQPPIRGADLRNLYASVDVLVGDSCLVGGSANYWSDRIPETLGRGGFLIHPYVEGLEDHFTDGVHLLTWPVGDWNDLRDLINQALSTPAARQAVREAGRAHVLEHHTYDVRVNQILEISNG